MKKKHSKNNRNAVPNKHRDEGEIEGNHLIVPAFVFGIILSC